MVAVYEEQREEKLGRDGVEITRTFRVEPYSARGTVYDALLGGVRILGGRLIRTRPARDPWYPWCYCVDVKTTPVEVLDTPGSNVGLAQLLAANYSESARMVATYKTLDHDERDTNSGGDENEEKQIATETWDFASTGMLLPGQYWKWRTDENLLINTDMGVTRFVPTTQYSLVRHFCINIPFNAINRLMNTVNKSSFLVKKQSRNATTVRLDGAHISHKVTNQGLQFAEIDYRFAIRNFIDLFESANTLANIGWNDQYRAEKGWWERPYAVSGTRDKIYLFDEDCATQVIRGRSVTGFALLFHPGAT